MKIGFLGGGGFGNNFAELLVEAGHDVVVGLRDAGRARPPAHYRRATLAEAAEHGEIVVIAIPYMSCAEVLPSFEALLRGKIVVDATNPLDADWAPLPLGQLNSAAEEVARLLPGARLVKAFNTIFAEAMKTELLERAPRALTAFVAGDDDDACAIVARIAADAGFAPLITGGLTNARYLEAMANLNIQIAVVHRGGMRAGFLYLRNLQS